MFENQPEMLFLKNENGQNYLGNDWVTFSSVYATGELKLRARGTVVGYDKQDEFDSENPGREWVYAVFPSGHKTFAMLFFWGTGGYLVDSYDYEELARADRKYIEKMRDLNPDIDPSSHHLVPLFYDEEEDFDDFVQQAQQESKEGTERQETGDMGFQPDLPCKAVR